MGGTYTDYFSYLNVTLVEGYGVYVTDGPAPLTPTPTPTSLPFNSYCANVEEDTTSGTGAFSVDDVFTIPIPALYEASCVVLMPEFTIPASAINIIPGLNVENDIYFPGFTLCIRGMEFGYFIILGITVNLDFYAWIIGTIMIIRKVLRS
jgi:hypothetical protein